MKQKYAFIDRDGTLIYEPTIEDTKEGDIPYQIDSIEKLKILSGVIEGLQKLIDDGYKLVMVTNQNGMGSKIFPAENFWAAQNKMMEIFKENVIEFEEVLICSHMPEDNCNCRKPKTGLMKNLLKGREVDFENSLMIGDRQSDRKFAENIGVKYIEMPLNGNFSSVINQIKL